MTEPGRGDSGVRRAGGEPSPSLARPAAVVAGASGLVGRYLLEELLRARSAEGAAAYREVLILTRRPLGLGESDAPATGASGSGGDGPHHGPALRELVVDFEDLVSAEAHNLPHTLASALAGGHLFCALGTTIRKAGSQGAFRRVDHDYPLALGRMARACGATFFGLVSSVGADPGARSFYLRVKGEVEEALGELGLASLVILRPSVLGGARAESRPLETVSRWILSMVPGRYRTVHGSAVARTLVTLAVAGSPEGRSERGARPPSKRPVKDGGGDAVSSQAAVRVVESEEIRQIAARG